MQERSTLQDIPRSGGTKTVIKLSINTECQETLRIGSHSKEQSNPPKDHFLTPRSRKLPTRVVDLGNS